MAVVDEIDAVGLAVRVVGEKVVARLVEEAVGATAERKGTTASVEDS